MHTTRSARYRKTKEAARAARLTPEQAAAKLKVTRAIHANRKAKAPVAYKKPSKPNRMRRRPLGWVEEYGDGWTKRIPVMRRPVDA